MEEISGKLEIGNIKRCYCQGAIIKVKCPKCGSELITDIGSEYLSYPEVGQSSTVGFYCKKCDDGESTCCELELDVIVKSADIVLEYDPDTLREA